MILSSELSMQMIASVRLNGCLITLLVFISVCLGVYVAIGEWSFETFIIINK